MSEHPEPTVEELPGLSASDDLALALLEEGIATLRRSRTARDHLQELSPETRQHALGVRHQQLTTNPGERS